MRWAGRRPRWRRGALSLVRTDVEGMLLDIYATESWWLPPTAGQRRRHLGEQSITLEQAEATCAASLSDPLDVKDCVYDILATQDLDMVGAF